MSTSITSPSPGATDVGDTTPSASAAVWGRASALAILIPVVFALVAAGFVALAVKAGPHDLPVGVVAPAPITEQVVAGIEQNAGDQAVAVRTYDTRADARAAIADRSVSGALVIDRTGVTALTADAGSSAVSTAITAMGKGLAEAQGVDFHVDGVVPAPSGDPRGTGVAAGLFPMIIVGLALGISICLTLRGRLTVQLSALVLGPLAAGLGFALVWQWLGVIDARMVAVWSVLSLAVAAIAWFAFGVGYLFGVPGIAVGAVVMMLLANPLSGAASSPYLLPAPWGAIGQWFPPGAGATLARSVAFFPTAGIGGQVAVLVGWVVVGAVCIGAGRLRRR
ncbi:ABC transporter permease [Gordonia sp. NPDC003376]